LLYADNVNLLGKNINTVNKNKETPLGASKEMDLEGNTEKTKYMFMSHHQNAEKNHSKIANKNFKNVPRC